MRRPRLAEDLNPVAGLAAVALFGVLAAVFLTAQFPEGAGFSADAAITEGIGYALFDLVGQSDLATEGFLFAFITIAIVLDAALDGAIMLARRDDEEQTLPDGGERR
jgi:NADH-quinone oxidoreductase subunit J